MIIDSNFTISTFYQFDLLISLLVYTYVGRSIKGDPSVPILFLPSITTNRSSLILNVAFYWRRSFLPYPGNHFLLQLIQV